MHLAPYLRGEKICLLDDTQIKPGANWLQTLDEMINQTRVAVLIVSARFLASEFITTFELPRILLRAKSDLSILWIPVAPSAFDVTVLREIQAASDPKMPLSTMSASDQDQAFVQIAKKIAAAMDINAIGNAFKMIDDFTPQVTAFVEGNSERSKPAVFGQRAKQSSLSLEMVEPDGGRSQLITADQLMNLDEPARQLIRSYETAMSELFDRWTELKVKRVSRDSIVRERATAESDLVRQELCMELTALLDFIESMGMSLLDHYYHIRYICRAQISAGI